MKPEELKDAYLAEELSLSDEVELDAHLADVDGAAEELWDQVQIDNALHVLLDNGPSDANVVRSVMSVLRGKTEEEVTAGVIRTLNGEDAEPARPRSRAWAWIPATAAAAAVVIIAVLSGGPPPAPEPPEATARAFSVDLDSGISEGDGQWSVEGPAVRQSRVSPAIDGDPFISPESSFQIPAETGESVAIEAEAEILERSSDGRWGLGLVAGFPEGDLVVRALQEDQGVPVFEFADIKSVAYALEEGGRFRMKLQINRDREGMARFYGKLWKGDVEPEEWMIEDELPVDGPLMAFGLHTVRCAANFTDIRVAVVQ